MTQPKPPRPAKKPKLGEDAVSRRAAVSRRRRCETCINPHIRAITRRMLTAERRQVILTRLERDGQGFRFIFDGEA